MAWWYRSIVEDVARDPMSSATARPLSVQEGCLLTRDRGHALIAFSDLDIRRPVWLPVLRPNGEPCWLFEPYPGQGLWGTFTLSTWLHNRRENLIAADLLWRREPRPQKIRRDKIFNPKRKTAPTPGGGPKQGSLF
jgi:hypothetical protein